MLANKSNYTDVLYYLDFALAKNSFNTNISNINFDGFLDWLLANQVHFVGGWWSNFRAITSCVVLFTSCPVFWCSNAFAGCLETHYQETHLLSAIETSFSWSFMGDANVGKSYSFWLAMES